MVHIICTYIPASLQARVDKGRKSVELAVTALCVSDVTIYEYLHY